MQHRAHARTAAIAGTICLLLAAGCGGDAPDDIPGNAASTSAADRAPADGETHSHEEAGAQSHAEDAGHSHDGAASHTHADADTVAAGVALDPGSGATWKGAATLLSVGDSLRVLVSVEGAPGDSRHPAELVAGTCDDPGPELASLTPVAAGSSGNGSSQTTLPAARLEGHAHGAVRLMAEDGATAACAPVHLGDSQHTHG